METTLEDFLKTKSKNTPDAEAVKKGWIERKDKWVNQVDTLFDKILEWLRPLGNEGQVKSEIRPISLTEEQIGAYQIHRLTVFFLSERVEFQPRGTNLFGGFGRIDITGKNGQAVLVIPEWGDWAFYQLDRSNPSSPKSIYEPLSEDSFKRVMLDLIS